VNLEADGMEVDEAGDGLRAIEAANATRPDVILLDVMLPGEDGFAVARRLRDDPTLHDIPVIFLTARADLEDRERMRSTGAVGYVTKPFNPTDLASRIRTAADRK
jgi:DNA-binding response OmpR family regulator